MAEQTLAQVLEENARLKAQIEAQKRMVEEGFQISIGGSGTASVNTNTGRWPIALYKDEWAIVLDHAPQIRQFIAAHADKILSSAEGKAAKRSKGNGTSN